MVAGLSAYRQILADPQARAFSAAGLVARLPISMTGLGIVLLISLTSGSFGRAGLVAAVGTLTGAVAAPLWGQAIDRLGQARVLVIAAMINSASLALLVSSVQLGWPLAGHPGRRARGRGSGSPRPARRSGRAGATGCSESPAAADRLRPGGGPRRGRLHRRAGRGHLPGHRGPSRRSGVSVSAVIGLVGAVLLAGQRSTQPPAVPRDRAGPSERLPLRVLVPISLASLALGAVFGGMEVVVVAFARETGVLPYAGLFITVWSFGSLLAGVVTGAIAWRAAPRDPVPDRGGRAGRVAAAAAVPGQPAAGRRAAAGQRDGHRPDADRHGRGDRGRGAHHPADRGAQLEHHRAWPSGWRPAPP